MSDIVSKALVQWGMESAEFNLIAARENQVFRVDHDGAAYAMRLHRSGYRSDAELKSELQWMRGVSQGGLNVPVPIVSNDGSLLHNVDSTQVDMLTWLPGKPLGSASDGLNASDHVGVMRKVGCEMARLHLVFDQWRLPQGFARPAWDREGLVGDEPIWGKFWNNPELSEADKALFLKVKEVGEAVLMQQEQSLDYGLIHADLVRENILINEDIIQFIDFDDGGFGFRLFDLATTLLPNIFEPDYEEMRHALIEGYHSVRPLDIALLDLFMLLRAMTYIGWIIPRMHEEASQARNHRFIKRGRLLANLLQDRIQTGNRP